MKYIVTKDTLSKGQMTASQLHPNIDVAKAEAERLCKKERCRFFVWQLACECDIVPEVQWTPAEEPSGSVAPLQETLFVDEPENWHNVARCGHGDGGNCVVLRLLATPKIDALWVCNTHYCDTCRLSARNPARAAYIEEVKARVTAEKMETK